MALDVERELEEVSARAWRSCGELDGNGTSSGVDVTINAHYKHSRVKQYFKDGRAMRIETVINNRPTWGAAPARAGSHGP